MQLASYLAGTWSQGSGPSLALVNPDGNPNILFAIDDKDGASFMHMYADDGTPGMNIGVTEKGEPVIVLDNPRGEMRGVMAITDEGGPAILLKDGAGKNAFKAP